jgi:hypothetical protein
MMTFNFFFIDDANNFFILKKFVCLFIYWYCIHNYSLA